MNMAENLGGALAAAQSVPHPLIHLWTDTVLVFRYNLNFNTNDCIKFCGCQIQGANTFVNQMECPDERTE